MIVNGILFGVKTPDISNPTIQYVITNRTI